MRRFGEAVGMAFQIQDDILDYTRTAHTGKPANNDLREHKITLPLLAVLEQAAPQRRAELLEKLALIPAIFLVWDIYDLITYRDPTLITYIQWAIGILSGAIIGYILINPGRLSRSSAPRSIHRPADYSALPFMLMAFGVKYVLGVLNAISPDVLRQPAMSALAIITGGMFAGIFVGKFTRYVSVWLRLPAQNNH